MNVSIEQEYVRKVGVVGMNQLHINLPKTMKGIKKGSRVLLIPHHEGVLIKYTKRIK